jgi:predicted dehydrogenase
VLGQSAAPATSQASAAAHPKPAPEPVTKRFPGNAALRVGMIACGGKGAHNLGALAECGVTIAALCDIDDHRLSSAAGKFPEAKTFNDYRKMLETMGKELDAVCISTPDHCHAPAATLAMSLGKHVYCEKPLSHNIAEARVMAKMAGEKKLATQMGNQGHSSHGSADQVAWIRSGAVGAVHEVHVWTDRPIWPQGCTLPTENPPCPPGVKWDLWLGPAPVRPYNPCYEPFTWRGWWDFGTGALGDMACHIMDTAYWSLDLKNPAAVEAFSDGKTDQSPPNWSIIRYEFPQRGELPPVKMFWYDGRMMPNTHFGSSETLGPNGALFVGSKGTMLAQYNGEPRILEEGRRKSFTPPVKATTRPVPFDLYHHLEWVEACLGSGKEPGSNFGYAGPLTETVLLGNFAVRTGKRIEWDSANMKCTNVPEANQYVSREYRKGWELTG